MVSQRILVVDNDKTVCLDMASLLMDQGFEVAVAHCATKALKELKDASPLPDVISINLYMPQFVGWTLLKNLAQNEFYKYIGIILTNVHEVKECCMHFESPVDAVYYVEESGQMVDYFHRERLKNKQALASA